MKKSKILPLEGLAVAGILK